MNTPYDARRNSRGGRWLLVAAVGLCAGNTLWAADKPIGANLTVGAAGLSTEAAAQTLQGYNYVLKSGNDGLVESVAIAGENGSGAGNAVAAGRAGEKTPGPQADGATAGKTLMSKNMQGKEAIAALGANLPAVAAAHGMTPERFKEVLEQDATAWIDVTGRMYYVETPPPPQAPELASGTTDTASAAATAAPLDLNQTFKLHSRPGSNRVIYLDFNGQTITGTAWNNYAGKATLEAPAFDLTGNPALFDDTERARIQYIWQRVAEDYAAFNVDVTTEEPPAESLDRSGWTDPSYGTRALITKNVLNCACGGIAYVGVFDYPSTSYKPAWIFYDNLGAGNEKYVAEAITHEVGHNLGLNHDGTTSVAYYQGHGSGATGWAPIMGVGYYKELVQWSQGEYPNANNKQDDFSIIQTHGALVRPDDVGNTTATATTLSGTVSGSTVSIDRTGNIEQRGDVDLYAFATTGGPVDLTVYPAARGPNLDVSAELYDSAGTLVLAANPADSLSASLSTTLGAGTYYLKIDGTGKAATATHPGYTDYGSLGQYRLTGAITQEATAPASLQPPVVVASGSPLTGFAPLPVSFSSNGTTDDGTVVSYRWDFGDGTAANEPNPLHTYSNVGTYTAKLTVVDDAGLTASQAVTVTVAPDPALTSLRVSQVSIGLITVNKVTAAKASVTVTNGKGRLIPNATITGKWSSLVNTNARAISNSSGVATLLSPPTKAAKGTFTFSVTGISLPGYTYEPATNAVSAVSISR
ncbi:PKD domain-containing protein [Methylococcus sp. EFPC2]|uniref:PKD domain-containing protein n=1 Tax=Methylococcus sp. EFPC2 TaxID=2812648 RepID=UPI001966EC29|nr:PKD domain-containing protein [Methylococcus sp. EFPC2]QSA95577.1 PKD domain-containing protein [Methylococcus sp. EFPC2]